jgi:hypothetical protein
MADESQGNVERLRAAKIVKVDPLPAEYAEIIDELDPDEVGRLIVLIEKLVKAEQQYGSETDEEAEARPLVQCFVPL